MLGYRLTYVYFSPSAVKMPTSAPIDRLPKNSDKKYQMPWRALPIPMPPPLVPALWADSKMTMATASFRIDSPKMMV